MERGRTPWSVHRIRGWLNATCPQFTPDPLFADLPTVLLAEFGHFLRDRIRQYGPEDAIVRRCWSALNEACAHGDHELINAVQTGTFEQLCDHADAVSAALSGLEGEALSAFRQIAAWAAPDARLHTP